MTIPGDGLFVPIGGFDRSQFRRFEGMGAVGFLEKSTNDFSMTEQKSNKERASRYEEIEGENGMDKAIKRNAK